MRKQILDEVTVVSVLDSPHKDTGKVYPKVVVCDAFATAYRVGLKPDQVARFKQARGTVVNMVVAVWSKTGRDGRPFDSYELLSCEAKQAVKAA